MSSAIIGLEQIRALEVFDTPTVANALESIGPPHAHLERSRSFLGPGVRSLCGGRTIVGVAVTATMKDQWGGKFAHLDPWLRFLEALENTPLPCVAVFDDESTDTARAAMVGEGMSRVMRAVGAVGVICDGVIRDIAALREMNFPVWARGLVADRASLRFHRYQVPVEIDGMRVMPGDLIHADENGAVIVPADRLDEVLHAAGKIVAKELNLFKRFSRPDFRVSELYEFYADALQQARENRDSEF